MANTKVQLEAEDWIRREWLPTQFGLKFYRERVKLSSGGVFDFDAVSEDQKIVACISTSSAATASGKNGVGKFQKLRGDMLFLLMSETEKQFVILTQKDMYERCIVEKEAGRVPNSISFLHVKLPDHLECRLILSRDTASKEVRPNRSSATLNL